MPPNATGMKCIKDFPFEMFHQNPLTPLTMTLSRFDLEYLNETLFEYFVISSAISYRPW